MKNYAPKTIKELVQELEIIEKDMADYINEKYNQDDYENGYLDFRYGAQECDGPLHFFSWSGSVFSFGRLKEVDKKLNKIFKKKKKNELNQLSKKIDYTGCNSEIAKFLKKHGGKRGILCRDEFGGEDFVVAYLKGDPFPYRTFKDEFAVAFPVKKRKKTKKKDVFFDEGYALD